MIRDTWLEGEEQKKSHHQAEKSHGLGEREAQDGVGEKLLLQRRVSRVADDQRSEHAADSRSGSGDSDGGGAGADVLGGGVDVHGLGARLEASDESVGAAAGRSRRQRRRKTA